MRETGLWVERSELRGWRRMPRGESVRYAKSVESREMQVHSERRGGRGEDEDEQDSGGSRKSMRCRRSGTRPWDDEVT